MRVLLGDGPGALPGECGVQRHLGCWGERANPAEVAGVTGGSLIPMIAARVSGVLGVMVA